MNSFTPDRPVVVILLNKNREGLIEATANNIDPDLTIKVVTTVVDFNNESAGVTFNSTVPRDPQQTLSSAASKARYAKTM